MKFTTLVLLVVVVVIQLSPTLVRATAAGEEKVVCDMKDPLQPCLLPIIGHLPPVPRCCEKLTEHQPCMCGYIKDYWFGFIWRTPNAHKLFDACKIPYPTC
ncbi:unnamed protein product [Thlaspi arvense]|uniref:Bifunctional inhibitor/plant lipid transfer protein/seed storage helical domain-containing protein n=1 Tax=Thlaspi arvense TaxID=13288 RepID=A0AAU9RK31_THLAR|nr:unnamed protein product [Thlaspi arvense]